MTKWNNETWLTHANRLAQMMRELRHIEFKLANVTYIEAMTYEYKLQLESKKQTIRDFLQSFGHRSPKPMPWFRR